MHLGERKRLWERLPWLHLKRHLRRWGCSRRLYKHWPAPSLPGLPPSLTAHTDPFARLQSVPLLGPHRDGNERRDEKTNLHSSEGFSQ